MRTRLPIGVLLAAVSCAVDPTPTPNPTPLDPLEAPQAAVDRVALMQFTGPNACAGLEQHVEDRAVLQMRANLAQSKRWALQSWDYNHGAGGGYWGTSDAGASAAGGGSASGGGTSSGGGPAAFTTTNVQVAGVDEPDFVKNDGTRLFVLSGRTLETLSTWPASDLARRGAIELTGRPTQMFLDGNRVVVFARIIEPRFGVPTYCQGYDCSGWYSNATVITQLDVSDLANPRVTSRQVVPGAYDDARRIGSSVRVVTRSTLGVEWLDSWVPWELQQAAPTRAALGQLFDELAARNERSIRARTLAEWIGTPGVYGTTTQWLPLNCADIVSTNASSRLGLANIVTLDLDHPGTFTRQALLADVDQVYQSHTSLYLAQRHWWWDSSVANTDFTYLYRFDVTQSDRASFVSAGRITGTLVDQFSLDEQRDVLRVATTERDLHTWRTTNRVLTLRTQGDTLVELGRTPDLAPGESIMSARFLGDLGYVVTFRQVDPLFTLDLSDDANPRVRGSLKVPGFSTYLHPLDATHLLTIGTYVPEQPTDWRERHLQLAIFDVGDLDHPRQTFTQLVGRAWGWSEAQWDHHAFNYFAARGLLAVPFSDWYDDNGQWHFSSDLRVFHVDANTGFSSLGSLDMNDVLTRDGCSTWSCWDWYWYPMVRRSVMADDFVYAISSGGVRVARADALTAPLATVRFLASP
jgi:hypothetical protein